MAGGGGHTWRLYEYQISLLEIGALYIAGGGGGWGHYMNRQFIKSAGDEIFVRCDVISSHFAKC
jgi:hypothetical protein